MLSHHGRYDFSPISQRPNYSWPDGKRLAVYIALNVEQFAWDKSIESAIAPSGMHNKQSVYSWRDYGNRVGFWRLMDLFDELDIPIQAQLNSSIYEHAPQVAERLRQRGDEFLGHGITNSEEQGGRSEDEERALIKTVTDAIVENEGEQPTGWMSPWLSQSETTLDLLSEAGYHYNMDWCCDDQPIWMKTRNGRILGMPYPVELNDNRAIVLHKMTPSQYADCIIDNFDEMMTQSVHQPLVFPISLHTFVVGQPFRIRQLRRALKYITDRRDKIWLTRPGEICRHIESLDPGIVPGS
ncbi:MAG: polysaccharide deacetylase family protein [Alphaproteobacteria bacterium]|jgi:peptidoglycan/xylan/chitin deacetylase (PgdA/CDA1 family)|nr:polysaccharide deacetylase [Rhodospirillaceae bacterium]MDP6257179.1 polysaccharide deacetylase family protein [Alphaproteobacteria bacterium]MBV40733.1 polysaccharide deacetylase [Rhodospirillaceae bacterium]MDP7052641.1 polysaccharide deacetylase family protein [Alphaproteobacteria bacterium]MDP7229758.1 polysaccharide deacetylase family protein [Alphaproteobacteria bacterium]|tara:strand:- start:2681 stop:3571 length:891 start_codon:yes stop_codon:yes gene_type:complete